VRWLGELARHSAELKAKKTSVIAIAADEIPDMAATQTRLPQILLATDLALVGIKAWGAIIPDAEHPSPATFVVGKDGVVKWRRLLEPEGDWPTYADVARALD
jgi:peroxiredoxin